jgi:hypothetical protein
MKKHRVNFIVIAAIITAVLMCGMLYAADPKTKGLEVVPDTATAVVNKAEALLTGNLDVTMSTGKDKYRDDYDTDPLGRHIPRATLRKYDSGVR